MDETNLGTTTITAHPQMVTSPGTHSADVASVELSDTDDDYVLSDEDEILTNPEHLGFTSSLSEHATYFSNTISHALDSLELDKSLALQAKLSGELNNENQKIIERKQELSQHLKQLQDLLKTNLVSEPQKLSKVEQMSKDLESIELRILRLKNGQKKGSYALSFLRSTNHSKVGVVEKYPIEYNQARDKVTERQLDQ
ncbi:uncharacterized protein CANTADRAFT_6828 [Suhomyces tanzawaensis NRRL Y-17324]|uniref:Biogenesis of lysosome-related organelles complex 1 subunit KXD1 n=1 Tax=Suhomyces tanzawaensis NRRL Y-17324 TaxID=984487 RepID=A0A1E4SG03_9ASCO|nr:uncharacterized protein CANTADRAFT_6828 [Suhomyces tanzawaensis NRRL Y-17324]ODV78437.1 hypothetical protein CANTADRAFT_6828 [Suhomyces tanzawaensis NRRL Y-17324]